MGERILNRDLLPGNECFGCGHENPRGLRIEVTDEAAEPDVLAGRFTPPEHANGFPGMTHGGALFTAMDCLATWTVVLRGPRDDRYWVLGSSEVAYRKPAVVGEPLRLAGRLIRPEEEGGERLVVGVEVEDREGDLVAEGRFHEVPVTAERIRRVTGTAEIPEEWRTLFERGDGSGGDG